MAKDIILRIEDSIKKNWDLDALTDYKGCTLQYKDVARKIEKLHIIFEESGVKPWNAWRVCLVGEGQGPDMYELAAFLGKEETLRRMAFAVETLN